MKVIDELITTFGVPSSVLNLLSPKSQDAIQRLLSHDPEPFDLSDIVLTNWQNRSSYPQKSLAAVLVLLFEDPESKELHVLLTTRSKALRSHPGQTALPGGKCDDTDPDIAYTAYREANEEVNLPLLSAPTSPDDDSSRLAFNLTLLRPFMSKYHLIVTPLVALLNPSHISVLSQLIPSAGEVDRIFHHPLEAILQPELLSNRVLAQKGGDDWPYEEDLYNASDAVWADITYRMHRFRSIASPIKGLTSDILIMAAQIAFNREPVYERWAPGQPRTFADNAKILQAHEPALVGDVVESKHSSREKLVSV